MEDRLETAAATLDIIESMITSIAASLSSAGGIPAATTTFNSLLGVRSMVSQVKTELGV
ncbi:hypothetical protein [Quatrionicoccus australiensis]|uniref:hypothetical protein n=1 Tax=Quatrionicoccus australiensis TaxID=138118 RepID=UPI001CF8604F|nr:hypothetical protein [Quatrionicoccus australiensis]UCV14113.1 hypothetical protein KI612_14335 [Quatrionicoccus australiensis]